MNALLRLLRCGVRLRCWVLGLVAAVALLSGAASLAQEARADEARATASSLPQSIPVRREASGDAGDGGVHWWIALPVGGAMLALAVLLARRQTAMNGSGVRSGGANAWWSRWGRLIDTVPSREIQRVSSMPLSSRHTLHVVVWNGRRLLLGCTDQSMQVLAEESGGTLATPRESGQ